jgi:hypothetical protein
MYVQTAENKRNGCKDKVQSRKEQEGMFEIRLKEV